MTKMLVLLLSACVAIACGGGNDSPTAPSTPRVVQVGGVWTATSTITNVTGGECFASAFQSLVGRSGQETLAITQTGSSLSATATDDSSGASCRYEGTAGSSTITMNLVSCTASDVIGARCPNGASRDIRLLTGSINATISGTTANGTTAQTYNVLGPFGSPVGTVTLNGSFNATRR